jgi:hypothetical protein
MKERRLRDQRINDDGRFVVVGILPERFSKAVRGRMNRDPKT